MQIAEAPVKKLDCPRFKFWNIDDFLIGINFLPHVCFYSLQHCRNETPRQKGAAVLRIERQDQRTV
jgi:hypothetical protein